jgi:tetratricopeptide (TPR) repeat protein
VQARTAAAALALLVTWGSAADASRVSPPASSAADPDTTNVTQAQYAFYTGRYDEAAARAHAILVDDPEDLVSFDLRSSALLFQLKQVLEPQEDKDKALQECAPCTEWLAAFLDVTTRGRALARARLTANPEDENARFFLGKLDLNFVWLQLGALGKRKGWNEYWEARKSFDAILEQNPHHVRARVSRAWIDYIVATRMPRGTRWVVGGGNRNRALVTVRNASATPADKYTHAEAQFSLWDMLVREKRWPEAVTVAQGLARDFPENLRLIEFVATHNARLGP